MKKQTKLQVSLWRLKLVDKCILWAKFFGLNIIGIRRSGESHKDVDKMYLPEDLLSLLPEADFILNTAPHTPQTELVFEKTEFNMMKKGAGFYDRRHLGL